MTTTFRMYQVDAFSNRVFGGNPAAVLVLDEWLPDGLLLAIGNENNLAETAFVRSNGEDWDLRWFTPTHEVDFCGHATLATAHVLATECSKTGTQVFNTRVGTIKVTGQNGAYKLDIPAFTPEHLAVLPEAVDGAFDQTPKGVFQNFENLFVELRDETAVREFEPDFGQIAALDHGGMVITAQGKSYDFVSRYFAPKAGIPEDPVTGSTHSTLVPYWSERLGKDQLLAFQVSKRGGELDCELSGDRVLINGQAVTFMKADIFLP